MRYTDNPQNHPDLRIRKLHRGLTEIWHRQNKLENTPSSELNLYQTHSALLQMAKDKDAILAEIQQVDPSFWATAVAKERRRLKDVIALEEEAKSKAPRT